MALINIGFGNTVLSSKVVAILNPSSAPVKRMVKELKEDLKNEHKLIDATQGRRTRAVIITESDHVILSAVQPETISQRFPETNEQA